MDAIDECGYTSLHCAADNGHVEIVKELLKAGANINKVTKMPSINWIKINLTTLIALPGDV